MRAADKGFPVRRAPSRLVGRDESDGMAKRSPQVLTVLAGDFASQPEAFAALLGAAERQGLSVDLAEVDVIREARETRLAHYFRPAILARICAEVPESETLLVIRPSVLTADPGFPDARSGFRLVGRFAGEVVEPE